MTPSWSRVECFFLSVLFLRREKTFLRSDPLPSGGGQDAVPDEPATVAHAMGPIDDRASVSAKTMRADRFGEGSYGRVLDA